MFNTGLISIYPQAIGATDGAVTFYKSYGQRWENSKVVDNYYGSSSIRKPKLVIDSFPGMEFKEDIAQIKTLDTHIQQQKLEGYPIDFIWADIQGAEIDLIKGGVRTFRNVRYFYTEYENSESYEGQINLTGILEMLPYFEIVEDYNGDVLLKNKTMT
jgi:FkbM family methyltransferase